MSPECQDSTPAINACYASAPNDVWSLGVILVNLVCGRNPWKRASTDDSTYRAFLKNPCFLSTILPISYELEGILGRIFEPNPTRRISMAELRELVLGCGSFSSKPKLPTPPPSEPNQSIYEPATIFNPVAQPFTPPPTPPHITQRKPSSETSDWEYDSDAMSEFSDCSSQSSVSECEMPPTPIYHNDCVYPIRPQPHTHTIYYDPQTVWKTQNAYQPVVTSVVCY